MASPDHTGENDLGSLCRAVQDIETRSEDPTTAIRYLENIFAHPNDTKYRRLKKSNRKFESEVWLQPGVRAVFLAIGFEERKENGMSMVVLDPFPQEQRASLAFVLQRMKEMRERRRNGHLSGAPTAGVVGTGRTGDRDGLICESCGKTGLTEDTASNRPDVLWRARRPGHAVTCTICGPDVFVVCGECFNNQAYRHAPEHQLILYGNPERLAEQNPWPTRRRGRMPPPPGPGAGGRPRRGPWG